MKSLKSMVPADSGQAAVNGKCCWQPLDTYGPCRVRHIRGRGRVHPPPPPPPPTITTITTALPTPIHLLLPALRLLFYHLHSLFLVLAAVSGSTSVSTSPSSSRWLALSPQLRISHPSSSVPLTPFSIAPSISSQANSITPSLSYRP